MPNGYSYQPVHTSSLIKVYVGCIKEFCIVGYPTCAQSSFRSDYTNVRADLNLRSADMPEGSLSDVVVQIVRLFYVVGHFNL